MMFVKDILAEIEKKAPLAIQESYDNSGLMVGNVNQEVTGVLICLDITREILDEALLKNCNLIISHHPVLFKSLKSLNPSNKTGKIIIDAIKNDVVLYSAHTNFDNANRGVSFYIAEKFGLKNPVVLNPVEDSLRKLVTYCPTAYADVVRKALFEAGAGHIGNYDSCSFNVQGFGSFRGLENSNPFAGKTGSFHTEPEIRIETVFPYYLEKEIIKALKHSHPYEEVAYDVYQLQNENPYIGSGIVAELEQETELSDFLIKIKSILGIPVIKYAGKQTHKIKKVALCGGAGSFLISNAIRSKADIYLTGDLKYHDFTDYAHQIILADIGHFESEQFVREQIRDILIKKFPTFAVSISERDNSPVYFL